MSSAVKKFLSSLPALRVDVEDEEEEEEEDEGEEGFAARCGGS